MDLITCSVSMFLPIIPDIVVPAMTLGRAAHQLGELLSGQLVVAHQGVHQLAQVQLRPDHLEPFLQLLPLQGPAVVRIDQVECLSEGRLVY